MFLNPDKPIATCVSGTCIDCPARDNIHCHFSIRALLHFYVIAFPPFLLGAAGIYHVKWWLLVPWLAIIVSYFGFIEIRVMCSHCPHYAESGSTLRCWANYGSPKIWRYRPGPMTLVEKIVFLGGFVIVWGYPLFFLVLIPQWFLLVLYILTVAGFFMTLKIYLCAQCMNFACPLNSVKDKTRRLFFERNPEIARAWGIAFDPSNQNKGGLRLKGRRTWSNP